MSWSEILHIAGPALSFSAVVVGFVTALFMMYVKSLSRQLRRAEKARNNLQNQLEEVEADRDNLQSRTNLAEDALKKISRYRTANRVLNQRVDELTEKQERLDEDRRQLQSRAETAESGMAKLQAANREWQRYKLQVDIRDQAHQHSTVSDAARIQQLTQDLGERNNSIKELEDNNQKMVAELRRVEGNLETANTSLEQVKKERFELGEKLAQMTAQFEGAVEQSGRVWEKPMPVNAAVFVPLLARKATIISIINLKGGVGKTTLAANLGASLGQQGKRVLFVDLDYQRSLSLMCCSPHDLKMIHSSAQSLQHFFLHNQPDAAKFASCMFPVKSATGCQIVAVSESRKDNDPASTLEDAEMRLMAQWLLGQAPEVRTHLRRALHDSLVSERFDYVLLDCPPRFSTACINGLVASDFALVPVQLDHTSAISAENLLRKLQRLRDCHVLAHLGILGIVANDVRFYSDENLIKPQAAVWGDIRQPCRLAWGKEIHFFAAKIKQSSAVADAADRQRQNKSSGTFAAFQDDLLFTDLVREIQERMTYERSCPTVVSA